jgi:hypothetical protein
VSDELKVTIDMANVPIIVQALQEAGEMIDALRAERDAAQADAARYRALWEGVPWSEIICMADSRQFAVDQDEMQDALDILDWAGAHAPKPQGEEEK